MYFFSIILYLVGALVCSLSDEKISFSIGRAIMALGGGTFMTIGRLLANTLPGHLRFNGICFFCNRRPAWYHGRALASCVNC